MQETPPGNEGRHDQPPAIFMIPYVFSQPVLDNIVQSTNILSGGFLSHKNALIIPLNSLPPIGLWQMAERTHFPCCVVAMATPNPAPIRLCDLIVSESQKPLI